MPGIREREREERGKRRIARIVLNRLREHTDGVVHAPDVAQRRAVADREPPPLVLGNAERQRLLVRAHRLVLAAVAIERVRLRERLARRHLRPFATIRLYSSALTGCTLSRCPRCNSGIFASFLSARMSASDTKCGSFSTNSTSTQSQRGASRLLFGS